MKKAFLAMVFVAVFFIFSHAYAWDWTYNGLYAGSVESGLFLGADVEKAFLEGNLQPVQISGVGTLLPSGVSKYEVNFHINASTWDAYTTLPNGQADYFDVFAVVLTEKSKGFYWDLLNTGIHPLTNNPDVLLCDLNGPDAVPWWGGQRDGDGILDTIDSDVSLFFTADSTKEYYASLFLQTTMDSSMPSWGTITSFNVKATPEPISSALFLLGGGAMALRRYRRKKA